MAQIHIALIGLLAISGALAQVPSYTVTYTSYSESITTLLETSTTSTHCKLISGLIDVGKVAGLTAAQNTTYYEFLNTLETTVINNSSITNETVKLFYAAKVIAEFNITQPQIFTQINQYNITGWSTVSNFISITNSYNLQTSLNLIVSTDSTGSTEFYNQIVAALSAGGYTTELTAFEAFWSTEVKSIILDTTITESVKWAQIYAKFINVFFYQYNSYYSIFYQLDFGAYGSFYQLFQNGFVYYQNQQVSSIVLGDASSCQLLIQLNAAVTNMSLPFPNTVRGQIKQFYNALYQAFQTTTTLEGRLAIINQQFGSFVGLQWNYFTWFQYVGFGNFGSFYQLVCYIGTQNICGGSFPENGVPPTSSVTTSAPVTPEVTTVATTEAASEATSVVTSESPSEATSEATSEVSSAATSESTSEATSEASSVATSEVSTAATSEASSSATSESTSEATSEVSTAATSEATSESSAITSEATSEASSTVIPSSSTQCSCVCE